MGQWRYGGTHVDMAAKFHNKTELRPFCVLYDTYDVLILLSVVEFTSVGCTLRFLLDWAWAKVGQIKDSTDKLCKLSLLHQFCYYFP